MCCRCGVRLRRTRNSLENCSIAKHDKLTESTKFWLYRGAIEQCSIKCVGWFFSCHAILLRMCPYSDPHFFYKWFFVDLLPGPQQQVLLVQRSYCARVFFFFDFVYWSFFKFVETINDTNGGQWPFCASMFRSCATLKFRFRTRTMQS